MKQQTNIQLPRNAVASTQSEKALEARVKVKISPWRRCWSSFYKKRDALNYKIVSGREANNVMLCAARVKERLKGKQRRCLPLCAYPRDNFLLQCESRFRFQFSMDRGLSGELRWYCVRKLIYTFSFSSKNNNRIWMILWKRLGNFTKQAEMGSRLRSFCSWVISITIFLIEKNISSIFPSLLCARDFNRIYWMFSKPLRASSRYQ